ncbi:MAG: membrane protease subunit HflK [Candidatus Tokpelaia sp. JSC188]|nr:MAG: membrane protease subunit HflK [Candidatus Tokpelaia sp. JSC188]
MPWNNQNDSGNNNESPWGNYDDHKNHRRWPSRRHNSGSKSIPPDISQILRQRQKQLKQFGSKRIFLLVIFIITIFWVFQSFYVIQQNEQAIELRFGKPKEGIVTEGLHFRFWPIDTYRKVPRTEQTATIGIREQDGLMLSGDQNIVHVNFSVYYYIIDPTAYLFNVNDQEGTIQQVAESAMREVVGRRPADDIYRDQREIVASEVLSIIQSTLNKYGLGIDVTRISITEAAPPHEVAEAFNSVQQAEQERNRAIEQGNQERAQKRGIANGEASRIREAAAAYKARIVEEAHGEAQRFSSVAKEARAAPEITRFRLYLEAIEEMLSSPDKIILDKSGGGTPVSHLLLNEIMRNPNSVKEN